MILSFLKRERERSVNVFHYSFQSVYCVTTRKFLGVPDRYHDHSWPSLKRSGTVNGQKRSGTVRNGTRRWTVRDVERYATIILCKINDLKRLQNYVHVHVSKTKELLYLIFKENNIFLFEFMSHLILHYKKYLRS